MYKILLVDDASFMRKMVQTHLSKLGYTNFIEAEDGEQAFIKYSEEKPDLVIMDITMPNLDGIGALEKIKSSYPEARVVMCSAMGQEKMVMEAVQLGALDFIVKPFKPDRLKSLADKLLPLG